MPPKPAAKAPAKTGAKPAAKPAAKAGAKPAAKAAAKPAAKTAEPAAPPAPKPITWVELSLKDANDQLVVKNEVLKECGKWPACVNENGVFATFLRHRDTNMIDVPSPGALDEEKLRLALIGSIKYGKPMVLNMMEADMWDSCVEAFDKIEKGLMNTVLTKQICDPDVYIKLYRDGVDDRLQFENKYNYNVEGFKFMVITQVAAPSESMLQQMYCVKVG